MYFQTLQGISATFLIRGITHAIQLSLRYLDPSHFPPPFLNPDAHVNDEVWERDQGIEKKWNSASHSVRINGAITVDDILPNIDLGNHINFVFTKSGLRDFGTTSTSVGVRNGRGAKSRDSSGDCSTK